MRSLILAALTFVASPVEAQTAPVNAAAATQSAPASQPRQPADAATRARYERADPLSRSIFWAVEQEAAPQDPEAGVKLAQALRELGQFDKAAEAAQTTLAVQPANVEAMLELGRAQIARGQAFFGIEALERARDLRPQDWRPLSLLGVAYDQVRRPEDAGQAWSAALALSPENPTVLANMAMRAATDGDLPAAEALLRRASGQREASLQVRQNLALVLGLQGKLPEAEQILRRHLPPEAADRNLEWLRARTRDQARAPGRTWDSLQ